ncbi:MAG: magnesium chelatase domain-containing protein, partial [Muribaculaceae bacterium]|nr:magnesium chelatase domain-containing protein [Muribaculaceae bacterium]
MLTKTYGAAVSGIDAIVVTMEVSIENGMGFCIVGLPDAAVKESYERVRSAIKIYGVQFPHRDVVVNMSPADVRKEGAAYDLPIAVAVLAADGKLANDQLHEYMIMGELSLDGTILPIRGILPMAIKARAQGFKGFIVPRANAREAAVVNDLDVIGVDNIFEVVNFFNGMGAIEPTIVNTR